MKFMKLAKNILADPISRQINILFYASCTLYYFEYGARLWVKYRYSGYGLIIVTQVMGNYRPISVWPVLCKILEKWHCFNKNKNTTSAKDSINNMVPMLKVQIKYKQ